MIEENKDKQILPASAVDVLRDANRRLMKHEIEAIVALRRRGDIATYKEHRFKEAEIILSLPEQLKQLTTRGITVSPDTLKLASYWADEAKRGTQFGSATYMGIGILYSKGSKRDEPNDLEKLITQLETPTTSK